MPEPSHLTTYDSVPYESRPFPQTHPDRLATVATMLGMRPKPVDSCRVLELGCAAGGNIVPMACSLPKSTFLGIDLSSVQVAEAESLIKSLGLSNIEVKLQNITDIDQSIGQFDYIICHGVYSWVPRAVQDKIFETCSRNLAPNGIAYVSYNTYPGWHMRGMIRDMMCYHSRHFSAPQMRIRQARNLLDFLAKSVSREDSPYALLLGQELELLRSASDSYLFHDHLEDVNEPLYFYQFIERAHNYGLQYLGESEMNAMTSSNFSPEIESVLQMVSPDHIHMEQYMDFLRRRMFRQTLLCHSHVARKTNLRNEHLRAFVVASPAQLSPGSPDVFSSEPVQFSTPEGATVRIGDPLCKVAMAHLAEQWPRSIPFSTLCDEARSRLSLKVNEADKAGIGNDSTLQQFFLTCYFSGPGNLVEFHVWTPRLGIETSDRPFAFPLARLQAKSSNIVTNLLHKSVELDEFGRLVLLTLDGQTDRRGMTDRMFEAMEAGLLAVEQEGRPLQDAELAKKVLVGGLDQKLRQLSRHALLVE